MQPGTSKGITDLLLPQPSFAFGCNSPLLLTVSWNEIPIFRNARLAEANPTHENREDIESNNKSLYDTEKEGLGSRSFQKALKTHLTDLPKAACPKPRGNANEAKNHWTSADRHIGYQGTIEKTQLSRQIIPRTKNGHAPPITQSWKD